MNAWVVGVGWALGAAAVLGLCRAIMFVVLSLCADSPVPARGQVWGNNMYSVTIEKMTPASITLKLRTGLSWTETLEEFHTRVRNHNLERQDGR